MGNSFRSAHARLCAVSLLLLSPELSAQANKTPSYQGAWTIESFARSPWGQPPADSGQLVGQSIVFSSDAISGPGVLACRSPRYSVVKAPAEGLFQGMLGSGTAAAKAAAKLGFRGRAFPTLSTGCEHSIDFHFNGARTAAFALDNAIYFIRKKP